MTCISYYMATNSLVPKAVYWHLQQVHDYCVQIPLVF